MRNLPMNALVVYKKSVYELYKDSSDPQTRAYIEEPKNRQKFQRSHEEQLRTLETITTDLNWLGVKHKELYRAELQNISPEEFTGYDVIISVGGDGTLLEVSHYVHTADIPVLGVNSDPQSSIGFFSSANSGNFRFLMQGIEQEKKNTVHRLQLIRDGVALPELVLNDILFAHTHRAGNTRFSLEVLRNAMQGGICANDETTPKERKWDPAKHYRLSYGIFVCTAAGSTAAMSNLNGEVMGLDSPHMQYKIEGVRGARSHFAQELKIISQTREGKIFIDGQHLEYALGLGGVLEILPGTPLTIVGDLQTKQKKFVERANEKEKNGELD